MDRAVISSDRYRHNKLEVYYANAENLMNYRIYGLPESTDSSGEDIGSKVLTLINEQAHVSPPLTPEEVDRVHRIGPRPTSNRPGPRPVILKLATYRTRARIFSKRTNLRNSHTSVYINEDLTKTRAQLLWKARGMKRRQAIEDCWSHDGQILIKNKNGKIIPVKNDTQLDELERAPSAT